MPFDPALSGQTLALTGGELVINNNLAIDASGLSGGLTLDGSFQLLSPAGFLPPARLTLTRPSPITVHFSWVGTNACRRLQAAPAVTGPWTDVPGGVSGVTLAVEPGARFFRIAE